LNQEEIIQVLKDSGGYLEGHFVLTSGLHSPHYVEKFRLLENPLLTDKLCKALAAKFYDDNISVVAGPMTGGIILAQGVALHLLTDAFENHGSKNIKAIFTERVDGVMKFRRGFTLRPEDRVLIVEDIISTGGSVKEVIGVVKSYGSEIAGIGCLVDRSGGKAEFGVPLKPLVKMDVVVFQPDDCPLCKANIPVTKPGSTNK
jgi:orotate phosphoribosyltransferase